MWPELVLVLAVLCNAVFADDVAHAYCNFRSTSNNGAAVTGSAEFVSTGPTTMSLSVSGIAINPDTLHGVHIHNNGDLSSPDGSSVGSHYVGNAWNAHGCENSTQHHAGDTGNWEFTNGVVDQNKTENLDYVNLHGAYSIIGRSVVIHSKEDPCFGTDLGSKIAYCIVGYKYPGADTQIASATTNIDFAFVNIWNGDNIIGNVTLQTINSYTIKIQGEFTGLTGDATLTVSKYVDQDGYTLRDIGVVYTHSNGKSYFNSEMETDSVFVLKNLIGRNIILKSGKCGTTGAKLGAGVVGIADIRYINFPVEVPTAQFQCPAVAYCEFHNTDNNGLISGNITFVAGSAMTMFVSAFGINLGAFSDGGYRGIHIHTYGDLSNRTAARVGTHYAPLNTTVHGCEDSPNRHMGDTGNWWASSPGGKIQSQKTFDDLTVSGSRSIIGRSIIIHSNPDPCGAGDLGTKTAYCTIGKANPDGYADPAPVSANAAVDFGVATIWANNVIIGVVSFKTVGNNIEILGKFTTLTGNATLEIHPYADHMTMMNETAIYIGEVYVQNGTNYFFNRTLPITFDFNMQNLIGMNVVLHDGGCDMEMEDMVLGSGVLGIAVSHDFGFPMQVPDAQRCHVPEPVIVASAAETLALNLFVLIAVFVVFF